MDVKAAGAVITCPGFELNFTQDEKGGWTCKGLTKEQAQALGRDSAPLNWPELGEALDQVLGLAAVKRLIGSDPSIDYRYQVAGSGRKVFVTARTRALPDVRLDSWSPHTWATSNLRAAWIAELQASGLCEISTEPGHYLLVRLKAALVGGQVKRIEMFRRLLALCPSEE